MAMTLQSYKEIAAYLTSKIGEKSVRTLQRYAAAKKDPMPVRGESGPVVADTEELDKWIMRRWRLRRRARTP